MLSLAHAAEGPSSSTPSSWQQPKAPTAQHRAGLVLGVAPGFGMGAASGYPNNVELIGNRAFFLESPILVGSSTNYFLMGALSDMFSFGPTVNVSTFESSSLVSRGLGIGFRAELFPLVPLSARWSDTAIYGHAGVGSNELRSKSTGASVDGVQSFLGVGLHHEFRLWRALGGHFAIGPYAEYNVIASSSADRQWGAAGVRLVWYGGTVERDLPQK